MSRQQLQDSEAAAVPDKAMLATVLNYLKNKNLKETEEVLKKELSDQGDDSIVSLHSISAVGQSGAEPMKYEESYISKALSTPTPVITTAAYLKQQEDSILTTALLYHSANNQSLHNNATTAFPDSIQVGSDDETDAPPAKRLPPLRLMSGEHCVPSFSNSLESISNAISIAKVLGASTPSTAAAAVAACATKTLDSKPIRLHNPLLTTSTAVSSPLFTPCSMASSMGRPSAVGGKPLILPGTSVTAPSVCTSTVCHPMMYQIMSSSCMARPLLAPVLTVLKSPPSLVNTPSMLLSPLSAQNLAVQSVVQTLPETISSAPEEYRSIAEPATGQAIPQHEFSPVSSTTTTNSFPHPRTLASIPPSELTPQLIELKSFAEDFKTRRIQLGFTQGSVGQSLAEKGYNNFAQSTISRFEQMQLSPANAATIRVILEKWLLEAESPEPPTTTSANAPQMAGRKRKKRAVFTPQTRSVLEEFFAQNPRPNRQSIENISQKLDLLPEEVRVWFCNKRQKSKSGPVHRTSFDRESSLSSGVPSPTMSDGGMSLKRRSPSPPKTPFTIEELSKSSTASTMPISSPTQISTPTAMSPLGIMASMTPSMSPLFSISSSSYTNPLLPAFIQSSQIANTRD